MPRSTDTPEQTLLGIFEGWGTRKRVTVGLFRTPGSLEGSTRKNYEKFRSHVEAEPVTKTSFVQLTLRRPVSLFL